MAAESPISVVQTWHDALNQRDVERVLSRVTPDVDIAGPRGSARGAEQVRVWVDRAGIRMVPTEWYAGGDQVVVQEETSWTLPDGTLSEPMLIATVFQVTGDRISRIARYSDIGAALNATGLTESDSIDIEGAPPA
jgi:limonene-1,2-epoxide hydrolase